MSIATINNGDNGAVVRAALNGNLAYLDTKPENLKIGSRGISGKMDKKLLTDSAWFGYDASTTGLTVMSRIALAAPFDAIRILIPNFDTNPVPGVRVAVGVPDRPGAWVSAPPSVDSVGNAVVQAYGPVPAGTTGNAAFMTGADILFSGTSSSRYRYASFANLLGNSVGSASPTSVTLPASAATNSVPSWTPTDWIMVPSVPRADGGSLPLVDVRIEYQPSTTAYVTVTPTKSWARWGRDDRAGGDGGTFNNGRLWRSWAHAGLGVTNSINFQGVTTPSTIPYAIPFIVQYRAKGKVISFLYANDSIGEFNTTGQYADSYAFKACLAWAAANPTSPIEFCPITWPSGSLYAYGGICEMILDWVKPTLLAIKPLGPNDLSSGALTSIQALKAEYSLGRVLNAGLTYKSRVIIEPTLAMAGKAFDASDSIRRDWNAAYSSNAAAMGYTFANIEPSLTTTGSTGIGGMVILDTAASSDGTHLIEGGHLAATTPFQSAMNTALVGLP